MAAGVHFAAVAGSVIEAVLFLDIKRIHIGAQRNAVTAVTAVATAQYADDTGFRQPLMYFDRGALQKIGNQPGCCGFFKRRFRMLVDVSAPTLHVGL